jgi:N-acetyl-gamma-glutamyl-phosphate/LysW-gamma-L-alpha-aminoadipyl-6-phosphate reductase
MIFKSRKKLDVGIIGAAGYGGSELMKLLLFHPRVDLTFVTSRRFAGRPVSSINRFLSESTDLHFVEPDIESLPRETDLVFIATPHGTSMTLVPDIRRCMPQARIIDLSGDFRLNNRTVYTRYYGKDHSSPGMLEDFVYGLTELNRDRIRDARYVANPGCFATGIIFALYPLFRAAAVAGGSPRKIFVTAVTGSSGSGESPKEVTHHPIRAVNFKAYKILEHQHLPEIDQFFRERIDGWNHIVGMVPHSGPFVRGIFTTAQVYGEDLDEKALVRCYHDAYDDERFVRVVEGTPEIVSVYTTNYVEVSVVCREGFVVAMSAIDNLVRGASGQAVQNMNLMFGFPEEEGLSHPGMKP